jgi:DNA-binding transcriptional MocR family regulator
MVPGHSRDPESRRNRRISLAGGLPAPELFPVDEYRRAFEWVFETEGAQALQYGPSEGYLPLRTFLAERLSGFGMPSTAQDVLITNGSQQALDLIAKILLNPGDVVLVENPTYLGALQAFNQYQPRYVAVGMDEEGMRVDEVERALIADRGSRDQVHLTRCPISRTPPRPDEPERRIAWSSWPVSSAH